MRHALVPFVVLASLLPAQGEVEDDYDADAACAALAERADRGELDVAVVLRVLGGRREQEARTVAAIVRHEWAELPNELIDGLDRDPTAARRFLEELARAPRPAAQSWVRSQSAPHPKRSYDHRLLALAARSEELTRDEAALLVESVAHESPDDGFWFASSYVPQKVADGLVGRVHAVLAGGEVPIESLDPLLSRLSARGTKSLLGLAMTLPPPLAHKILRHVHETRPELVQERVEAALDGRIPLDPQWLAFAAKQLDRPERVQRVVEVLRQGDGERARELAFEALLQAGVLDEEILEIAVDDESIERIRRVISRAAAAIPTRYVVAWLGSTPEVVQDMAQALARRRQLEPEVQRAMLALLADVEEAHAFTPLYLVTALVGGGDAEALRRVWPLVLGSNAWRDLIGRLGRRDEPFVYELLLGALDELRGGEAGAGASERHQQQLDALRLQLVARGDRRELDELIAHAPSRDAQFVRRCGHYAEQLSEDQAERLIAAAFAADEPELAAELLEWVAKGRPETAARHLWQHWQQPPDDAPFAEDLAEVVMRLLMATDRREDLLAQLRDAIAAGPLSDRMSSLPYEALNGMPEPLHETDVRLCADLLLRLPITDPEAERRMVRRWPDGTFGFPLVAAIANRLRTVDQQLARRVFAEVVEELRATDACAAISRQRLKVFWRALSRRPSLQKALGRVTARLWSCTAADDAVAEGAAIWLQAYDAECRDEFAA
ncbi:MAG: hypothetical protein KAI24_01370, partial [Planctomycetes bacterium]|nr:hypothetical protein [Planctomycetota bacterium]